MSKTKSECVDTARRSLNLFTGEELEEYIADDSGGDLKLIVNLTKRFGGRAIAAALRNMPSIKNATRVYSTAHKVKGLGFESVQLASDFATLGTKCVCKHSRNSHGVDWKCRQCKCPIYTKDKPTQAELRLLYVAITRAKLSLDKQVISI